MPRVISDLSTWLGRPRHSVVCSTREEAERVLKDHLRAQAEREAMVDVRGKERATLRD